MMLFVVCQHCKQTVEHEETLAVCHFIKWECPFCGAWNDPVGQNITEEIGVFDDGGETIEEELVVEIEEMI